MTHQLGYNFFTSLHLDHAVHARLSGPVLVTADPWRGCLLHELSSAERLALITPLLRGETVPLHLCMDSLEQHHPGRLSMLRMQTVSALEVVRRQQLVAVYGESDEVVL